MKKPRWLRIHLSTAVLMSILAGIGLWINMYGSYSLKAAIISSQLIVRFEHRSGWPFSWYIFDEQVPGSDDLPLTPVAVSDYSKLYDSSFDTSMNSVTEHYLLSGMLLNGVIWLLIMGGLAFLCEWRIARAVK